MYQLRLMLVALKTLGGPEDFVDNMRRDLLDMVEYGNTTPKEWHSVIDECDKQWDFNQVWHLMRQTLYDMCGATIEIQEGMFNHCLEEVPNAFNKGWEFYLGDHEHDSFDNVR